MNRLEQQFRTSVMSVSDEGNAHPRLDGFVLPARAVRGSARAVAEEERGGDRQAEAQNQYQRLATRRCHELTIERLSANPDGPLISAGNLAINPVPPPLTLEPR